VERQPRATTPCGVGTLLATQRHWIEVVCVGQERCGRGRTCEVLVSLAGATRRTWVMDVEDGETARASPRSTKSIAVGPSSPRSEINEDVEAGGRAAAPASSSHSDIVHSGWLSKRAQRGMLLGGLWQRRYFTLIRAGQLEPYRLVYSGTSPGT
jgi:hypothetical protein